MMIVRVRLCHHTLIHIMQRFPRNETVVYQQAIRTFASFLMITRYALFLFAFVLVRYLIRGFARE